MTNPHYIIVTAGPIDLQGVVRVTGSTYEKAYSTYALPGSNVVETWEQVSMAGATFDPHDQYSSVETAFDAFVAQLEN